MKNFSSILIIFFFSISLNSKDINDDQQNCVGLAFDTFDAYYDNGYSYQDAYRHMNWAYEGCVNNGGYPGEI